MTPFRVADHWEETFFHDRSNRFTLILKSGNRNIRAYLPNTGRLEEYLVEGSRFFIVPFKSEKFRYRVVSTFYQEDFVLLDTVWMNHLVRSFIEYGVFPWLTNLTCIKQEKGMGHSRFDFCIERKGSPPLIIEVKTCTLVHKGIAMFPDAPTHRAFSHLDHMSRLRAKGFEAVMLFVVPHSGARLFRPNFHTDPRFSDMVLKEQQVSFRPFTVKLTDPVTVDPESIREIPIDLDYPHSSFTDRGTYLLVLENNMEIVVDVGSLGPVCFPRGYFVYVGSALNSLSTRLKRHRRIKKKKHWHIDYLTPKYLKLVKTYAIHRPDRIEEMLAERVGSIAHSNVLGFGSSDSRAPSHLFHFKIPPFRSSQFIDIVLDYRMGTE